MEAEAFVATHPEYTEYVKDLLDEGITPIFEWCSNKNRIVLDYPEDRLVLTGLRSFWMGHYFTYQEMVDDAKPYGIPVVEAYSWNSKPNELIDWIRQNEDTEGVVVRFDDGHMVKIKTDWYVRIHKVKSLLGQERDVVSLILNNELDDLLPVLPKEDVERVEKFRDALAKKLSWESEWLRDLIITVRSAMDRKTFAMEEAPRLNPVRRGMIFSFWDKEVNEHLTYQAIVAMILKNCGNNGSYAKVKEAFLKDVDYV
jgi:RNA ligase